MANQIVDKALNNLAQVAIVESGTYGAWTWRKYGDGTADLWLKYTEPTASAFTASGNLFYRSITGLNFPFTFTEVPKAVATVLFGNVGACMLSGINSITMGITILSSVSTARAVTIHAHVYGKWK